MVLIALSVLLGIGLLMRHNAAEEQKRNDAAQITKLDTNLKDTEGKLTDQKKVNESLLQTNAINTITAVLLLIRQKTWGAVRALASFQRPWLQAWQTRPPEAPAKAQITVQSGDGCGLLGGR